MNGGILTGETSGFVPAQSAVLDWAASISRLDREALSERFRLALDETVSILDLHVSAVLETRTPLGELPADPNQYVSGSSGALAADLWADGSPPPEGLADVVRVVPGSVHVRDCLACSSSGSVICDRCGGDTSVRCALCSGLGRYPCESCKGFGKSNCLRCGGRGLKPGAQLMISSDDACPDCSGIGKTACRACRGGEVDCRDCAGKGRVPCSKCETKGKAACPACAGSGSSCVGLHYRASFRRVERSALCAAAAIPAAIEKQVADRRRRAPAPAEEAHAGMPEHAIRRFESLEKDVAASAGDMARVAELRAGYTEHVFRRIRGDIEDRTFELWIDGQGLATAVANPFESLLADLAAQAQAAADAEDWAGAGELARRALLYGPDHGGALKILKSCRRGLLLSAVRSSALAGAVGAGVGAALVAGFFPGINKTWPALQAAVAFLAAGVAAGPAAFAFIKTGGGRARRFWISFGAGCASWILVALIGRFAFGWDGVLNADRRAFSSEFAALFPHGVSDVYWEDDLARLRDLQSRYSGTRVDLSSVRSGIEKQEALKRRRRTLESRFAAEVDVLSRRKEGSAASRAERLQHVIDLYRLESLDVSRGEKLLAKLNAEAAAAPAAPKSTMTISTKKAAPKKTKNKSVSGKRASRKTVGKQPPRR